MIVTHHSQSLRQLDDVVWTGEPVTACYGVTVLPFTQRVGALYRPWLLLPDGRLSASADIDCPQEARARAADSAEQWLREQGGAEQGGLVWKGEPLGGLDQPVTPFVLRFGDQFLPRLLQPDCSVSALPVQRSLHEARRLAIHEARQCSLEEEAVLRAAPYWAAVNHHEPLYAGPTLFADEHRAHESVCPITTHNQDGYSAELVVMRGGMRGAGHVFIAGPFEDHSRAKVTALRAAFAWRIPNYDAEDHPELSALTMALSGLEYVLSAAAWADHHSDASNEDRELIQVAWQDVLDIQRAVIRDDCLDATLCAPGKTDKARLALAGAQAARTRAGVQARISALLAY